MDQEGLDQEMSIKITRVSARDAGGCQDCGAQYNGTEYDVPDLEHVNAIQIGDDRFTMVVRLCDQCLAKLTQRLPGHCVLWERCPDPGKLLEGLDTIREVLGRAPEAFSERHQWYSTLRLVKAELRALWAAGLGLRAVKPEHRCPNCGSCRVRVLERMLETGLVWWPHCVDCEEDGDDYRRPSDALASWDTMGIADHG